MLLTAGPIQAFERSDIPEVANLWQRAFRHSTEPPSAEVLRCFEETFFDNPWVDLELPSLVYRNESDEIVGFMGRFPRLMTLGDRRVKAAVATQLMVDPVRGKGFAALQMVREFINGPQDLSLSDGIDETAWKIWQRCGGEAARLYCLEWTRIIRPAGYSAEWTYNRRSLRAVAPALRFAARPIDAMGMITLPPLRPTKVDGVKQTPATPADILPLYHSFCRDYLLKPAYDLTSLSWLLKQASSAQRYGPLRTVIVRGRDDQPLGWYIYYAHRDATAQVMQIQAAPRAFEIVFDCLVHDAAEQGAVALNGSMDPRYMAELSDRRCRFTSPGLGVVVHSRDKELLEIIHRGDAFISRLDGEWWMKFGIDRKLEW